MFKTLPLIAAVSAMASGVALAQSPEARIAELQEWRANCNDPEPDFRLAYLEAAVASDDASIARICIGAALASEDADMRDLGVRAALGYAERVNIDFSMPPEYDAAIAEASTQREREEIDTRFNAYAYHRNAQGGVVTLVKEDYSMANPTSTWIVVDDNGRVREDYLATVTVRGERLQASGQIDAGGTGALVLDLRVQADGSLAGTIAIGEETFPARADLI